MSERNQPVEQRRGGPRVPDSPELRAALERLLYLRKIRDHAAAVFGAGAPRARLHNREVTAHVARELDVEVSPALGRDVIQALRAAGWRPIKHARAVYWKGIVRL